ncbi:hypothetical protein LCGC14_0665480 [marine sediment metagenome]|uniref:Uncharacterized protein n=1 Tax=marine sediment metagenome TaxID=412755 RepID=A0A0F9RCJ4_9ZZZZ
MPTSATANKWQGEVEIGFIIPCIDESEYHLRRFVFQDMEGNNLFDILPYAADGTPMDGGEGVCRAAGQAFVLDELGWTEYDEIQRRMTGTTIRVDLSGIDLG